MDCKWKVFHIYERNLLTNETTKPVKIRFPWECKAFCDAIRAKPIPQK